MKEIILVKNGEIALKGQNRAHFEEIMVKNIKRTFHGLGRFHFRKAQSTIEIEPPEGFSDMDEAVRRLARVFGIAAFVPAALCRKEMDEICRTAAEYLEPQLRRVQTFKVESKRSDKRFPLTSPEISAEVGGYLLDCYPHLSVDLHQPELTVTIEVRDFAAYVRGDQIRGAGGMPCGSSGNGLLLLSGGIDSPVAGYMMQKRGLYLTGVHFETPPYTSERARGKVLDLAKKLCVFQGRMRVHCVPITELSVAIRQTCPDPFTTVILRRFMMRIAEEIAKKTDNHALITGESLAQVASQTLAALHCTNTVCTLPVLRPLIGMDKGEIIEIAQRIDTFETSIEPFEDCCTIFTPRHPKTKPKLLEIEEAEAKLPVGELIQSALAQVQEIEVQ